MVVRNPYVRNYALTTGMKRARIAYAGASYLYKHRKGALQAGRTIYRAYRRYKTRSKKSISGRHRIGERVHQATAKRATIVDTDVLDLNTRTLYSVDLTSIPKNIATDDIDRRDRNLANIRGFKLHLVCRHITAHVMQYNIAVISPKSAILVNETNFFRGTGNERGIDFDFATLSSNDFRTRHINTDIYNILMHKRYKLHPLTQGAGLYSIGSGKNWMTFDRWVPLKRQLRYDSTGDVPSSNPVYLVYWWDGLMENVGEVPNNAAIRFMSRVVTHFKDPKG
jgi:hypothetical protein